jgi:glyoxylase-like metal-dependent hydrolase (beta-lactamase superfamily II)
MSEQKKQQGQSVNRRAFLGTLGVAGASLAAGAVLPGWTAQRARAQSRARVGTVVTMQRAGLTLHTYMAPDASALVTSHVIETPNNLVVVDTQLLQTFGKEVLAFTESLGKPVERVILSHQHPDHWAGADLFAKSQYVSTKAIMEGVQADIDGGGPKQRAGLFGEAEVPATPRVPEGTLTAGDDEIDGVKLSYQVVNDAEAPEQIIVKVPQARTLIVQDLIYSNAYYFPLANLDGWIKVLETVRGMAADYDTLLCGHGLPTGMGEVDAGLEYVKFMKDTFATAKTAEEATAAITGRYPTYGAAFILTFIPLVYANR